MTSEKPKTGIYFWNGVRGIIFGANRQTIVSTSEKCHCWNFCGTIDCGMHGYVNREG